MNAICVCRYGHTFSTKVVEDDPDTNVTEVEAASCPHCGVEDFGIEGVEYEGDDE